MERKQHVIKPKIDPDLLVCQIAKSCKFTSKYDNYMINHIKTIHKTNNFRKEGNKFLTQNK